MPQVMENSVIISDEELKLLIIGDGDLDQDVIGMCSCSASDDSPYN